ncbi:MAG: AAA family ATPase [Patescibacteria group bacterium]|nr:AAA family ATPase [Patescibacteria group bacterium]
MATSSESAVLRGVVESVRVFGEGWAIASMWDTKSRKSVRLTGTLVAQLKESAEYEIHGNKRYHAKFGESVEPVSYAPYISEADEAIAKFIAAHFKGIGGIKARQVVKDARESGGDEAVGQLRQLLLNDPESLDLRRYAKDASYLQDDNSVLGRVVSRLQMEMQRGYSGSSHLADLAAWLVAKVRTSAATRPSASQLADQCWSLLKRDPYAPVRHVPHYGFVYADEIGRSLEFPADHPSRLSALVYHACKLQTERYGHVYLTLEQFTRAVREADPMAPLSAALTHGIEQGDVVLEPDLHGEQRLYETRQIENESATASLLAYRAANAVPLRSKPPADAEVQRLAEAALGKGKRLDESQVRALIDIVSSPSGVHTLSGGPGSGKTAIMEVLIGLLPRRRFVFCSPTGKAAKVLGARVGRYGMSASTIHSLLHLGSDNEASAAATEADSALESCNVLVVDETSMLDLSLARAILKAAPEDAHIIFVGDDGQLPSIRPGQFFSDLLRMRGVQHARLTTTHRNSGGILEVVQQTRNADLEIHDRESVTFSGVLPPAEEGFDQVQAEYLQEVDRYGIANVALLMSRRQGDAARPGWNTTYANHRLRLVCNPFGEKVPGTFFHVGDRIIVRENMSINAERVVNGDTGTIVSYVRPKAANTSRQHGAESVKVALDDGREIDFPSKLTRSMQWAYALTVHAAQGSEYQSVILVAQPAAPTFINRNMLYTGLSRAKKRLHVVANDMDLHRIVATAQPDRNSALIERYEAALSHRDRDGARTASDADETDTAPMARYA